jgi:exosome complex RNA-binding protein Rrp4
MIARKEAEKLLRELADRDGDGNVVDLRSRIADVLATSQLVLRGTENVEQKARRYLTEGRLRIERVDRRAAAQTATSTTSATTRAARGSGDARAPRRRSGAPT